MGGMRDLSGETVQDLDAIVVRIEHAADIRKYERLGIPVIDVAGAFVHDEFYRVQNDDRHTGRLAGSWFATLGHFRLPMWAHRGLSGPNSGSGV